MVGSLALSPPAVAQSVVLDYSEATFPATGIKAEFPRRIIVTAGGQRYILAALGSGTRRQLGFKVYEAVIYAQEGADLHDPHRALINGAFAKHLVLRFARDTAGNKVRQAYEQGFSRVLKDPSPGLLRDMDSLLAYFTDGLSSGEAIELTWLLGEGLHVFLAGEQLPTIANDELARAVMEIYFGENPVSRSLKGDMVRFVGHD